MATYTNSSLVNYTKISPNKNTTRVHATHNPTGVIDKITIHHAAGKVSVETMGNIFAPASREASSNYGIGTDARVGLYVDEKHRAWTSGSAANDYRAVTIEVANDTIGGNWHVSDKVLAKLIVLCADICKRNGIKKLNYTGNASGNLTLHKFFQATACPGPYLESKMKYIADEVNKRITVMYRIRKSWKDAASQKGAYSSLVSAKAECDKAGKGYYVFDQNGKQVYSAKANTVVASAFKVGDKVKMKNGAPNYGQTVKFADWVYKSVLYVREIKGSRIVVSTQKTGAVTGAVDKKYLTKA